jgi:drug/metabolite transporter (DMT)-like permease
MTTEDFTLKIPKPESNMNSTPLASESTRTNPLASGTHDRHPALSFAMPCAQMRPASHWPILLSSPPCPDPDFTATAVEVAKSIEQLIFLVLGGLPAGDFALWNTSVKYTTVANATLLGNTAPLWVALGAWLLFREKLSGRFWFGLWLALAGATLILGTDFLLHPRLGLGDLMAIVTGVLYAGYMLVTQRSRQHFSPLTHVWLMGTSASFGLLVINLVLGNHLVGYSAQTWVVFFAAAIVSQIVGYMSLAYALGHLPASLVSPTLISQPIMSAILAVPLLGEIPTILQFIGGATALAGVYIVNQAHNNLDVQ